MTPSNRQDCNTVLCMVVHAPKVSRGSHYQCARVSSMKTQVLYPSFSKIPIIYCPKEKNESPCDFDFFLEFSIICNSIFLTISYNPIRNLYIKGDSYDTLELLGMSLPFLCVW